MFTLFTPTLFSLTLYITHHLFQGFLFDYFSSKRASLMLSAVLAAATYLLFLPGEGKPAM